MVLTSRPHHFTISLLHHFTKMFALCSVPIAPVRSHPEHQAEMTTQLVFGEYCTILESSANGFFRISCCHDGYEGFCMGNQLALRVDYQEQWPAFFMGWQNTVYDLKGHPMILPFGARWPRVMEKVYRTQDAALSTQPLVLTEKSLNDIAFLYLNTPYLWGGRTVFGADCSGFVQMVMGCFGYALPRDAREQVEVGRLEGLAQAQWGDLAFFEVEGRVVHVGILLAADKIIHAFGKVRIDKLDQTGIWNEELNAYSHQLTEIRRLK